MFSSVADFMYVNECFTQNLLSSFSLDKYNDIILEEKILFSNTLIKYEIKSLAYCLKPSLFNSIILHQR